MKKSNSKQLRDTKRSDAFRERQGLRTMNILHMKLDLQFAFVNVPENATDDEIAALHEEHCANGNQFEAYNQLVLKGSLSRCVAFEVDKPVLDIPNDSEAYQSIPSEFDDDCASYLSDDEDIEFNEDQFYTYTNFNEVYPIDKTLEDAYYSGDPCVDVVFPDCYTVLSCNSDSFNEHSSGLLTTSSEYQDLDIDPPPVFKTPDVGVNICVKEYKSTPIADQLTITYRGRENKRIKFYSQDRNYDLLFNNDKTNRLDVLDHFSYLFSYKFDRKYIQMLDLLDCEAVFRFFDACPPAIREYTRIYGRYKCRHKHTTLLRGPRAIGHRKCFEFMIKNIQLLTIGNFLTRISQRYLCLGRMMKPVNRTRIKSSLYFKGLNRRDLRLLTISKL